jgi:tRNA (cmo5U34)-methyltransferase
VRCDYNAQAMSKDNIYNRNDGSVEPFEFTEEVASVFPDMLKRSIPGYGASIQAIGSLARRYARANSRCYDLGCSLGAASLAMIRNIDVDNCRIVAVDNAPAMTIRCQEALTPEADQAGIGLSVIEANIQDVDIVNASMAVMNYTLQFIPEGERAQLISKIAKGMNVGGVLLLSEKVVDDDPAIEKSLVDLHHEFKRRNAYSDLEISRKRAAIENVLVPETVGTHRQRLLDAGFQHVGVWLRYFNFVSIIAIR